MSDEFLKELQNIKKAKFKNSLTDEPMLSIIEKIDKHYDEEQCSSLRDIIKAQKLIILYSKASDFEQALEIIEVSKTILSFLKNESLILGKIFLYPSFAYYYKKTKNYSLSKRYINHTVKFDDLLSAKFRVLHIHKIHHVINLHQLHLEKKEFKKCAELFADIFVYSNDLILPSKYGKSGSSLFRGQLAKNELLTIVDNFSSSYFMCIWKYPEVERYFLKNKKIKEILRASNAKSKRLQALIEFNTVQTLFIQKQVNFNLILNFFKTYTHYYFDIYKLLILKNLHSISEKQTTKNEILSIIEKKLNFKEPGVIIDKIIFSQA